MTVPDATPEAPTTDCPTCGRTAPECNEARAKGWDHCCQACDALGSVTNHRLRLIGAQP